MSDETCRKYVRIRGVSAAWAILAARRAPLILGCLKPLFDGTHEHVSWEDAVQRLARTFAENANSDEFELPDSDFALHARKELRCWLGRGLVVEREGKILATNALQKAFSFVDGLEDDVMTSTASRLATVQREIESLEARLNPGRTGRIAHIKKKAADLSKELKDAEEGRFEVLTGIPAREGIREVYQLAVSLRADFRRVEDSYREEDRELRREIVSTVHHRGSVLERMLDGHDTLLKTAEGQVFNSFYEQLVRAVELDEMKSQLNSILENPAAAEALNRRQLHELRTIVRGLLMESERVIQARARGERDVRGFITSGLASEHHRVGILLNEILQAATGVDWRSQAVRRSDGPLPPMAVAIPLLPLAQRLRFKEGTSSDPGELDLSEQSVSLEELSPDFWGAFNALDRLALYDRTMQLLHEAGHDCTLAELAAALPPTHDLETLVIWLGMAREAGRPLGAEKENIDIADCEGFTTRFTVPRVSLNAENMARVAPESLG